MIAAMYQVPGTSRLWGPVSQETEPRLIQNTLQVCRNCLMAGFIQQKWTILFSLVFQPIHFKFGNFFYFGEKEFKAPCPCVHDLDYLSPCVQALPMSRVHAFVVTKVPSLETSLTPSLFPSFQGLPVETLQFLVCISL